MSTTHFVEFYLRSLALLFKGQFDEVKIPVDFLLWAIGEFQGLHHVTLNERKSYFKRIFMSNMNIKIKKNVRKSIVVPVLFVLSVFRCLWFIVTLLFLNSRIRAADCTDTRGDEISLIKNLLSTIFERYKTDMTSLHNLVEMTTGDLNRSAGNSVCFAQHFSSRWRSEVDARLDNLDLALGTRTRHDPDQDDILYDIIERPAETLSGLTEILEIFSAEP